MAGETLCDLKISSWVLNSLFLIILLIQNIGLIANITADGSPAGAESAVCRVIFDALWQIMGPFVAGEPLCDLETPS